MREHRLFERMLAVFARESEALRQGRLDPLLMAQVLDFFSTYADLNHHGKEEKILFSALALKPLAPEHRTLMEELTEDHLKARKLVRRLQDLLTRFVDGDKRALSDMDPGITELLGLYPVHIEKEDKEFFFPILEYLSKEEQDRMLADFREFEISLLHSRYLTLVERLEGRP